MEYIGVFLYGIAITVLVAAACASIVFGIITEKRDRERLEAEQAAERMPRGEPAPRSD